MKRFRVLDSFRGLCALAIVIYHSHTLQGFSEWAFFRNAHVLVEFFFVLSGFVISHAYAQRILSPRQLGLFVQSRLWRIWPLHLAMLLAALSMECLKQLAEQSGVAFGAPSFEGPRAAGEILPNLLLVQSWWSGFNAMSFNYPAWSISVEVWLYLAFGLVSLAAPRRSRHVLCLLALGAFAAHGLGWWLPTELVVRGAGCFFAGCVTHQAYRHLQQARLGKTTASLFEVALLAATAVAILHAHRLPAGALALLFCLVVGLFAFEAGMISRLLRGALFTWPGTLSYSIYMTHALVLMVLSISASLAERVLGLPLTVQHGPPGDMHRYFSSGSSAVDSAFLIGQLALVLGLSLLTWRWIEQPGIALGKRLARHAPGETAADSMKPAA